MDDVVEVEEGEGESISEESGSFDREDDFSFFDFEDFDFLFSLEDVDESGSSV